MDNVFIFIAHASVSCPQSTAQYGSKDEILLTLEKHGGICDCQTSRFVIRGTEALFCARHLSI